MGKPLLLQRRGKGKPRFKVSSFRHKGKPEHKKLDQEESMSGVVLNILKSEGKTAPLALVQYEDDCMGYIIACEGLRVGQTVDAGHEADFAKGHALRLENIPEGTFVYNIESTPGDGGKFVRASGTFAKVVSRSSNKVVVMLPSKKQKVFHSSCMANVGVVAGGGRTEKPFLKAGNRFHLAKRQRKVWPKVSGAAQNAVDHPFGCKRSSRKSKATPMARSASPGRKVGSIAARRTGRRKK